MGPSMYLYQWLLPSTELPNPDRTMKRLYIPRLLHWARVVTPRTQATGRTIRTWAWRWRATANLLVSGARFMVHGPGSWGARDGVGRRPAVRRDTAPGGAVPRLRGSRVANEPADGPVDSVTQNTWEEKNRKFGTDKFVMWKTEVLTHVSSQPFTWDGYLHTTQAKHSFASRLHEYQESELPLVSRIEVIHSKLSNFPAHVGIRDHPLPLCASPGKQTEGEEGRGGRREEGGGSPLPMEPSLVPRPCIQAVRES